MSLVVALGLEWCAGDPRSALHPVALFGRLADAVERRLHADSRVRGAFALGLLVVPVCAAFGLLVRVADEVSLGWLVEAVGIWISIGWASLLDHVRRVAEASDLAEARARVALIVGRDTDAMDETQVRAAALESLAENASDAVVAPLFWTALLGPVAAIAYRCVNTLDAMWGHRSDRYARFGWAAARLDDALNWIPARLTGALLLLLARRRPSAGWQEQLRAHPSPNAGWPEVALAEALDVRLGGPVRRSGVTEGRPWMGPEAAAPPQAASLQAGLRLVHGALLAAAGLAVIACW